MAWTVVGTSPWPVIKDDWHVAPLAGDTLLQLETIDAVYSSSMAFVHSSSLILSRLWFTPR